jgi:hypothetical protein
LTEKFLRSRLQMNSPTHLSLPDTDGILIKSFVRQAASLP